MENPQVFSGFSANGSQDPGKVFIQLPRKICLEISAQLAKSFWRLPIQTNKQTDIQ